MYKGQLNVPKPFVVQKVGDNFAFETQGVSINPLKIKDEAEKTEVKDFMRSTFYHHGLVPTALKLGALKNPIVENELGGCSRLKSQ